jgi:hypothetical protein
MVAGVVKFDRGYKVYEAGKGKAGEKHELKEN